MYTIPTLFQFKRHLGIPESNTAQDDRLLATLEAASRHVERYTGRRFLPYRATITHDLLPVCPNELLLTEDLLQLISVTDADGPIDTDDITLLPADGPASLLRINGLFAWDSPERTADVTGVWGWNETPLDMWQDTGDAVNDLSLSSAATTITVGDADAVYADGVTPRFAVGALLNIEDEFVRVLSVDAVANTLSVERGAQGTTAIAHSLGTPIQVYRPAFDALITVLRVAAWLYRAPDTSPDNTIPPEVAHLLAGLRRVGVRA
ncbi:MAG: phage head-tail connector protein [Chloroflexota bacterium]